MVHDAMQQSLFLFSIPSPCYCNTAVLVPLPVALHLHFGAEPMALQGLASTKQDWGELLELVRVLVLPLQGLEECRLYTPQGPQHTRGAFATHIHVSLEVRGQTSDELLQFYFRLVEPSHRHHNCKLY